MSSHSTSADDSLSSKTAPVRNGFFDKDAKSTAARATYLKTVGGGLGLVIVLLSTIFPTFWGSIWKTPVSKLSGWIVDFDGGLIGEGVVQALVGAQAQQKITWTVIPPSTFPEGPQGFANAILQEKAWFGVSINPGASSRLAASISSANASYDGSQAVTIFGVEARNENIYRTLLPSVQAVLTNFGRISATQVIQNLANSTNLASIITTSPQTIITPVAFTIQNLAAFDQPLATGVNFFGLLFQTILSFVLVGISFTARQQSQLASRLKTRSLIALRFVTLFGAYFIVSLLYSLLALGFHLRVTSKFGHAGFVVFWMLNYANMLSMGLGVEALLIVLPIPLIPLIVLLLMITNISVVSFPIVTLPKIYRYGYAMPFYNVSRALRVILFSTTNIVGLSFGILFAWICLSLVAIPVFQILTRRFEDAHKSNTSDQQGEYDDAVVEPKASTS